MPGCEKTSNRRANSEGAGCLSLYPRKEPSRCASGSLVAPELTAGVSSGPPDAAGATVGATPPRPMIFRRATIRKRRPVRPPFVAYHPRR